FLIRSFLHCVGLAWSFASYSKGLSCPEMLRETGYDSSSNIDEDKSRLSDIVDRTSISER
ncbi:MAG TPA: hypothetical protein PKD64_15470, partial [Pirellulaceae bacterium]|nr:hypothetical protein [Pirellulaceae bacterium]